MSFDDGLHLARAHRRQPFDQGRPVDAAVVADHRQPRQARAFDDSKSVAG